jgi:hypothetical protein
MYINYKCNEFKKVKKGMRSSIVVPLSDEREPTTLIELNSATNFLKSSRKEIEFCTNMFTETEKRSKETSQKAQEIALFCG